MSHSARSSFSSNPPSSYNMNDDIDAITPCPPPALSEHADSTPTSPSAQDVEDARHNRWLSPSNSDMSSSDESTSSSPRTSHNYDRRRGSLKAPEQDTDVEPERLWRRMLALQRIYGCYNSARMSAALASGDFQLLLPSKACLNLLNDNIGMLPDDVEQVLKQTTYTRRLRSKWRN